MNKRRLLKLADLLEADAKNKKGVRFDLNGWGWTWKDNAVSQSCGTSACAMGLAVLSGAFKRVGLYDASNSPTEIMPALGKRNGFSAARALFDLTREQAGFLFASSQYPDGFTTGAKGERYVAERIRDFVAGKVSPS